MKDHKLSVILLTRVTPKRAAFTPGIIRFRWLEAVDISSFAAGWKDHQPFAILLMRSLLKEPSLHLMSSGSDG
ncbi:hypothetical protein QR721_11045 [Aciduricibacillus chroicocephali]|uniref:Uncharacterized protein n=1 Tax=Aciduricibacillus chroicocephali TaxID=3054939 RepID=A0ABY9KTN0_9BACI|nr:hypothetical protein QR721_11045 [Bacillaceae bacterium 44XB]